MTVSHLFLHARARLVVHLSQSSPRCLEHLMRVNRPLEDVEVAELDHEDKLRTREEKKKGIGPRQALLPAVDTHGPKLPQVPWPERVKGRHGDTGPQGQQEEKVCEPVGVVRALGTASRPDDSLSEPWSDQGAPVQPDTPSVRTLGTAQRPDDSLSVPLSDQGAPATEVETQGQQEEEHRECVGFFKGLDACFHLEIQTVSKKGTALLLLRFGSVAGLLKSIGRKNKCNHPGGHKSARGLEEQGFFCTAPLKVFPPEICKLLATGFAEHLKEVQRIRGGLHFGGELRVDLQVFYQQFDVYPDEAITELPVTEGFC
ncbi:unnamed protein product [Polarella glacialis]|uniref:Uncharacterized protein n=1 Tax=Polarella glacialis TaxID=89957 RepID=A0A813FAJ0_POLGL|nr:unnamed protein product [Polarella glacialis]